MLKCSIKNVIVSGDLLNLSRKRKEDLDPRLVVTCGFQLLGFELLNSHTLKSDNAMSILLTSEG